MACRPRSARVYTEEGIAAEGAAPMKIMTASLKSA
jgi:hypothetical protein